MAEVKEFTKEMADKNRDGYFFEVSGIMQGIVNDNYSEKFSGISESIGFVTNCANEFLDKNWGLYSMTAMNGAMNFEGLVVDFVKARILEK